MTTVVHPPLECARLAGDALRDLAQRTDPDRVGPGGYRYPSDVYEVLGAVEQLLEALPEVLANAALFLGREVRHRRIRVDHGDHPYAGDPDGAQVVGHQIASALDGAVDALTEAGACLEVARQAASVLGAEPA